jgi:hypothetical protein
MILNKTLLATLLARGFLCPATTSRIGDSSLLQYFFIVVTVFFHRCYSICSSLLQCGSSLLQCPFLASQAHRLSYCRNKIAFIVVTVQSSLLQSAI